MKKSLGRTAKAAQAVATRTDGAGFVKADELVLAKFEAGKGLSITAAKALNLMIAAAAGEAWKDAPHRITRGDLRRIRHLTKADIEALLDELAAVRFKIEATSARGRRLLRRRPLFRSIDEEADGADDDEIEFQFDDQIRKALAASNHYTVLYKKIMLSFDSKYALRLYEIGSRQVRIGHSLIQSVPELRELFGVPEGTFKGWNDFRRFVLDKAFAEVNQVADFEGGWAISKRHGRAVTAVSLAFAPKDELARAVAAREREAHRTVRRARRKGTEEIVTCDRGQIQS
ncbi:MAG: replication initiation protein [Alphaproteobacteria bacterium]|nr:replication initiation protein [Alphaproteobacteria bacterium]